MAYFLQEKLSITLDAGRISDTSEHDAALASLDRMFQFMGALVKAAGARSNPRLALQTVKAISGLIVDGGNLSIAWCKRDFFATFGLDSERVWREIAGQSAGVSHTLNGEPAIAKELSAGTYGAGSYGSAPYGGEG